MKTKNLMTFLLFAVIVLCSSKKSNAQTFVVDRMPINKLEIVQTKIYPNPSAGQMNVAVENLPAGKVIVVLTDLEGRDVLIKMVEHGSDGVFYTNIDADDIPDGMYKVSIIHQNLVVVKKWTKG